MPRRITAAGMELMKKLHTFRPKAIRNADGKLAVGYGHTRTAREGQTVTESEAWRLLADDMAMYAAFVEKIVTVPITDNQFSALTAFCAHVSAAVFEKAPVVALLNRGWYEQVPAQLRRWGEGQASLHKMRRAYEADLWRTPDPPLEEEDVAA